MACADLLAACKAEDTYGLKKDYTEGGFASGSLTLFSSPNYDFKFLVGEGEALVFRRGLGEEYASAASERERQRRTGEERRGHASSRFGPCLRPCVTRFCPCLRPCVTRFCP